jgi:hypothetical protein
MIDHAVWTARLASSASALNGRAYDMAQYLRDAPAWPITPAAYVHPLEDDDDEHVSLHDQAVTSTVAVLMVVAATGTIDQAFSTLHAVRESVRGALIGWTPDGAFAPALFSGGRAEEFLTADPKAGLPATLVWRDLYRTQYLLIF